MYVLVLLAACWCVSALEPAQYYSLEDAPQLFDDFVKKYGRTYADEDEKAKRFEVFKDNLKKINELNQKSKHGVYGITDFADLSSEEFTKKYTGIKGDIKDSSFCPTILNDNDIPDGNAPEKFDWRDKNVVTPVKHQGDCGSCFAFSAAGNVESQYAMKNQQTDLSEQQILDCGPNFSCQNGGYIHEAFMVLSDFGGSMSENDYPYEGKKGQCRANKDKIQVKVSGCNNYNLTSQEKVKQLLVTNGPISICIASSAFQHHTGGIIRDTECTGQVDHAVLLVGYGADENNT